MKKRIGALSLLALLSLAGTFATRASGMTDGIALDERMTTVFAGPYIEYLEDRDGSLSLQALERGDGKDLFVRSSRRVITLGYTPSVYWLRFTTYNGSDRNLKWFLEIAYPQLDDVTFYYPRRSAYHVVENGERVSIDKREYPHGHIIFPVTQAPGSATYYLRVRTSSSMYLPVEIHSEDSLGRKLTWKLGLSSLFYGILIGLFLYNLILLFVTRDRAMLYFLLFLMGAMKVQLTLDGYGFQYLWSGLPWFNIVSFSIFLTNIFTLLFTGRFLSVRETAPWIDRAIRFTVLLGLVLVIVNLFMPNSMNQISVYHTLVTDVIGFTAAFVALRRAVPAARIFLISWSFVLAASVVRGLLTIDLVPAGSFTESIVLYGTALTAVLFSFSFADRYNAMRENLVMEVAERKHAEDELWRKNEDLKQSHRELLESEERFRAYTEYAPVGLLMYAKDKWIYANHTAQEISGYSLDELLRMNYWDFVHPDDVELVRTKGNARLRGDNPDADYRVRMITKGGETRWINVRVSALKLHDEITVLVSMVDVTSQMHAEESMRSSEEKFAIAFRSSPVIIGISRLDDGRFFEVNDAFCRILKHRRDNVIGKSSVELGIFSGEAERTRLLSTLQRDGNIYALESTILTSAHEEKHVLFYANIVKINDIDCLLVVAEDISARRALERTLREEHERMLVTLRSIGDGVITTDIAGRVELMNTVAEKLTGWGAGEAEGRPLNAILKIFSDASCAACVDPYQMALMNKAGRSADVNAVLITKNGGERAVAVSGSPIIDNDQTVTGVIIVFRDITEKLRLDEELLKIKKLESIGILAGGIAHDFNNILTAILGNINLARIKTGDNDELHELIKDAEHAAMRAMGLTKQLLTFSRGGVVRERRSTSIEKILRETCSFVLRGKNIVYDFEFGHDLRPIHIDPDQFVQIIQNLIINGMQAMPGGGRIGVRADNYRNDGSGALPLTENDYVRLEISDTGTGIEPETIDKIFDPFFTTKDTGTGLGLAITYSLIKNNRGYIAVRSDPGTGTTFTVFLPSTEDVESLEGEETGEARLPHAGRVLIYDDDAGVASIALKMFAHLGYRADVALNSKDLLDKIGEAKRKGKGYDLVILDLTVPGDRGGGQILPEVLRIDPHIKAFASSGYSNSSVLTEYEKYGFKGILPKPYRIEDILKALKI